MHANEPNRRQDRYFALFAGVFTALQLAMPRSEGTPVERMLIDDATVSVAARLIDLIYPLHHARTHGYSILSEYGRSNVLRGCEGTEVLFRLIATTMAHPASGAHA